jgi:hypothetical protein
MHHDGAILRHRTMTAAPDPCLKALAPYRDGLVVAVACLFPWSWLAALGADAGMAFVLGHALSMQALHGGKANNDKRDAQKIAARLRGGLLPPADVSPAEMRATRARLRRRTPLLRKRAALLAPGQNTHSPYTRPAMGQTIASKANRTGVAERCDAAAVPTNIAVDLALITSDDARRTARAFSMVKTAQQHAAPTCYRRRAIPGVGTILALVLL